jgi:hypothetical protein
MDKRHFTVVIGSKEHGLYISSKPSSAAKKAVSKLCAANKSKKVEFSLREITQGSKKKTYGPYLGEMKKLKKPIELKGRMIRHEIKLHLKKGKSSTIKTAKKMRGGRPFVFNQNLEKFKNFVRDNFHKLDDSNYLEKESILRNINKYIRDYPKYAVTNHIFYIYDTKDNRVTSIGIVGHNGGITNTGISKIKGKEYFFINNLLSGEENGGISAIYHILNNLPPKYAGICLTSTESERDFYIDLGFVGHQYLFILDKTPENISKLEEKLPHPITTEFYSTYPNNIIT